MPGDGLYQVSKLSWQKRGDQWGQTNKDQYAKYIKIEYWTPLEGWKWYKNGEWVSTGNPPMSNPSSTIYDMEVEPFWANKVKFHMDREHDNSSFQSMRFDWWVK